MTSSAATAANQTATAAVAFPPSASKLSSDGSFAPAAPQFRMISGETNSLWSRFLLVPPLEVLGDVSPLTDVNQQSIESVRCVL